VSGSRLHRKAASAARVGWLILPVTLAGLAHVAVLKADVLRRLAMPLDVGTHWRGRPLLGSNKTWRGVLTMTALTAAFTHLQSLVEGRMRHGVFRVCHGYRTSPWVAGSSMGLSYCMAELPNSFVKRRLGIAPGARSTGASSLQYLTDQADSVFGCLIALRLLYPLQCEEMALSFVLGAAVHIGVDRLTYMIGVKRRSG
jgi:CDP-archaeol synthase